MIKRLLPIIMTLLVVLALMPVTSRVYDQNNGRCGSHTFYDCCHFENNGGKSIIILRIDLKYCRKWLKFRVL